MEPPDNGGDVDDPGEIHPPKRPRHHGDKLLNVILGNDLASKLGLQYQDLLSIPQVESLWDINVSTSYLYKIVSLVLNVPQTDIKLFRQHDGMLREATAEGWNLVTENETSLHGTYLCKCNLGMFVLHHPF